MPKCKHETRLQLLTSIVVVFFSLLLFFLQGSTGTIPFPTLGHASVLLYSVEFPQSRSRRAIPISPTLQSTETACNSSTDAPEDTFDVIFYIQ